MPTVRTVTLSESPRVVRTARAIFGEVMACGGHSVFEKQPEENFDYKIDWARWLASDTLVSSVWDVDTGLTIGSGPQVPSFTPYASVIWLKDGEEGVTYKVTNTVTTLDGRTAIACFKVRVKSCDGC